MSADHFRTLLQYNRWANRLVLDKAALASPEDYFASAPGLSFGSLHATLVHALVAEVVWLARWQGSLPPEHLRDARASVRIAADHLKTFNDVLALWQQEDAKLVGFIDALTDAQVDQDVAYRMASGEPYQQPLHELMSHFAVHGAQFRAEAAVRLTQLGLSPGDLDLIVYLRQRNAG
jgi:uncharacterized damage-inducible protein DinB